AETRSKIAALRDSELTVKVAGSRWQGHDDYLDKGVSFFSRLDRKSDAARQLRSGIDPRTVENYLLEVDNRFVVPVDTKVRVLLTSGDVVHAWWVPEFGLKKDAFPGFITELWFRATRTGVFRGQCAEL